MKIKNSIRTIAIFISLLIISIPFIHAQEINYVLDANGNLVTGDSFYREYNELNQLIRIREGNLSTGKVLEEYTWHPVEERILIKDVYYNNTKNYTVYYVSKEYVVIENQTGNYTEEYIYQDNVLVAQVDTNGNKIAVHPDHEGSSTTFTNAQGNVLETTFYSAYGEILSGGKTSRFDYEGKEFDSEVQDYDFGFRKYNPNAPPIFHQPDTLIQNVYDPQLLNRYMFERANPFKYTDPTGHWGDPATLGIGRTVGTTIITGLTAIFAPEIVIGVGLIVVGGLVISVVMESNEAKDMYSTGQRGFEGKEYDKKSDWLDEELPRGDVEYPFDDPPPKARGGKKYKYDKEGNPIDKKGDSWRPDRKEKHWDVQHKGGGYTRVTPEGNILPFVATYSTGNKEQDKGISGDIKRTGGKLDWYYSEKSKTYTWRPKGSNSPSGYKKASK